MFKYLKLFLLLLTIVILVSCSVAGAKGSQENYPWQLTRVNENRFTKSSLKYMQSYSSINPVSNKGYAFYTGDVTGDANNEIVVIAKDTIFIYSLSGKLITKKTFPEMNFGSAILADIDSDSKKDIIIGSAQSKGVNIMAYSGVLEPVFNFLYSEIYNAETRIHFYNEGNIYFSAKSSLYIPPKIVGAYNIEKESISWNYFTGPAPLDIAANRDFTKLTISNTPKNGKGLIEDSKTVSDHSKFRSSIYVLDSSGTVSIQVSIGPEYAAGEFIKDGISSITERLYDLDGNGKDELIVGINRISDFYIGNAVLEIRSITGEVINKKEFSPNTDLDFSIFNTEKGTNIAVFLKSKGELYILDKDLTTLNRWKSNDSLESGTLHESGDFNGDGLIEHLITIGNHLFILDSELKVLFSTAFTSTIQKALFTPGTKSEPALIVQSNTIDLFHIGREETGSVSVFTNPPGADIYIDGQKLKTIPVSGILPPFQAGEVSFQAKMAGYSSKEQILNIETGQHYNLELKLENYTEKKKIPTRQRRDLEPVPAPDIPIKTWDELKILNTYPKDPDDQLAASGLIDFAGDSSGDLLFRNNSTHTYKIYDLSMNLLSQFQLPRGSYSTNIEIQHLDINNDSKSDLLINKRFNEEINIITAQGKFLYNKNIGQFPDSVINSTYIHYNKNLYFVINSGYSRHPRGMLGIDPENNKILFFSPTAAAPTKLLLTPENILLTSIHTPTNGSEITYSNGDTARDSEYYVYMTDLDGNHLNKSFNPKLKDNNGTLEYYLADLNMDNQKETYLIANKTNYYTGHSIIARLNMEKGTISEPLFTSGLNDQIYMHSVLKRNYNSVLAIYTRKPRILYFLSKDFSILKTFNMEENGFSNNWLFPDMNGDGNSEILIWDNKGLLIFDQDFNPLSSLEINPESGALKRLLLNNTNSDGKDEIIFISDNSISIYGY